VPGKPRTGPSRLSLARRSEAPVRLPAAGPRDYVRGSPEEEMTVNARLAALLALALCRPRARRRGHVDAAADELAPAVQHRGARAPAGRVDAVLWFLSDVAMAPDLLEELGAPVTALAL